MASPAAFLTKATTIVISYFRYSTPSPFRKGVSYQNRKGFAPQMSKFVSFGVDPFLDRRQKLFDSTFAESVLILLKQTHKFPKGSNLTHLDMPSGLF